MDLNQPFVGCNICHETGKVQSLYLTSCAHILCKEHASKFSHDPKHLETSKTRCMACDHDYVTIVKLDQRLPNEIRPFLTPFPMQVEQLFAIAQFQYCGITERIQYQERIIDQLQQKIKKQKGLLMLAKESVAKVEDLEKKIQELEKENKSLRFFHSNGKSINPIAARPVTIDMTVNDSFEEPNEERNRKLISHSFLHQVKQSSQQKKLPSRPYMSSSNQNDTVIDFSKGKIAESTNMLNNSPTNALNNKRSISSPSNTSGSAQIFSGGSSNGSAGSRHYSIPLSNRVGGNRVATSQIAQRLSAHMKVGNALHRSQSSSLSSQKRPGSSIGTHGNIFKRR